MDLFIRHTSEVLSGFEAYVGVENLFNEQYASLGYRGMLEDGYYPCPGITFRGGVSWLF